MLHVATKHRVGRTYPVRILCALGISAVALLLFGLVAWFANRISPWPVALVTRIAFTRGARIAYHRLEKHLPSGGYFQRNQHYDASDPDGYLDVYSPSPFDGQPHPAPTVVWIHGGAYLSGNKNDIGNYARILAAHNLTVVTVDYSLAPAALYPEPLFQINAALRYLLVNAERLHVDPSRLYLAGDSAGAQLAAQMANIVTSPAYAEAFGIQPSIHPDQLRGVLLYCGVYDLNSQPRTGIMGFFMNNALRSYTGSRDFGSLPLFKQASVLHYLTPAFPPAFLSAGNADPLAPQSLAFAQTLAHQGVPTDTLFYPSDYYPPLRHEYQFNLDRSEGNFALDRSLQFIDAH